MPDTPPGVRATPAELRLHQRLLASEVTAWSDLAEAYLVPLVAWLRDHNPRIDEMMCVDAAGDAIVSLVKNPASYDPTRQSLEVYLRMSAKGDLLNLLERERRHTQGRRTLEGVELSADARNYLGREVDPSLRLRIAEEAKDVRDAVPDSVRCGLSEAETKVLDLMLDGERKTKAYAQALGIGHLSPEEQRAEVKRVKDRLQKRSDRAGNQ